MSLSHKSRRKAGLLILAVTGLLAVTPMLSGCGGSGREEALKQAVYVGTGGYDPANDGKIVIVCGKLELLEPAYDEDLGITIEAPHVMRSGQKLKKKELNQAMTGNNMEWNSNFQYGDFIGKADVGEFHLGEDFLQNMMVRYDPDLDEKMLEEAGYAIVRVIPWRRIKTQGLMWELPEWAGVSMKKGTSGMIIRFRDQSRERW